MKYSDWIEEQNPSEALHRRLLSMERPKKRGWIGFAAAACCALAVGALYWSLNQNPSLPPDSVSLAQHPTVQPATEEATHKNMPALPEIHYAERQNEMAMDIAFPKGYFREELSMHDLETLFGETGWWEVIGWSMDGYVIYDGEGAVWQVFLAGSNGENDFSLGLSPNRLPPTCLVAEPTGTNDIWGTKVDASRSFYDCDGDGAEEYCYTLTFLREEKVGARLELTTHDDETAEILIDSMLSRLLSPERTLSLAFLIPKEIPAWREEKLTMEQAKQEPDFAAYLPDAVPTGMQFESAYLNMGQNRNTLSLHWSDRQFNNLSICIERLPDAETLTLFMADTQKPESYDLRLYAGLWDGVPEAYWYSIQDAIFPAEDMTFELLEARSQTNPERNTPNYRFQILHADGTLVSYYGDCAAQDMWALVQPTLP
jgi:hypothetical protein